MQDQSTVLARRRALSENLDRFIPNRSAMDFDYAHYMLTEGTKRKHKENHQGVRSLSSDAYQNRLDEVFNMKKNRRILAFKSKPPTPVDPIPPHLFPSSYTACNNPAKPMRYIPQTPERTLETPDILEDFCLNVLDWSCNNVIAIALGCSVYLWDASTGSTSKLVTVDEENGPVTSVNWAPDGLHIAVGLNDSCVQLWDSVANRQVRTLKGGHRLRVGSLAWNNYILTTGGVDGKIINHDVRKREDIVGTFVGHRREVCGLRWSGSGQQLASGANDSSIFIWDRSTASSNTPRKWIHRLEAHTAAVKALAWCPFQANLLASGAGGGGNDKSIKFWNTHTGSCLRSVDIGSEVCSLLWNNNERELLSSHGNTDNQLILWKYPSMLKMRELRGHTSRVLYMAQSPDGNTVASAAGDERINLWNVFGTPQDVLVRFAGFGMEEDEWVNIRKHVRLRSSPCESSECVVVLPGDLILCFQEVMPLRKLCRRPESDMRLQRLHTTDEPTMERQNTSSGSKVSSPASTLQDQQNSGAVLAVPDKYSSMFGTIESKCPDTD